MRLPAWAVTLLLSGCAAVLPEGADLQPDATLSRYDLTRPASSWRLPEVLDEVSGLVVDGADALLAHHDNDSRLWRLELEPAFAVTPLPGPWIDGDFEGVARGNGEVYLLRSPGDVYRRTREPAGPVVLASAAASGLCNFEGIESHADLDLLLACKYPKHPEPDTVLLYRLDLAAGTVTSIRIDVAPALRDTGLRRLRPSGLAWLPGTGHLLVLAGKERVLLELDLAGERLLAWRSLSARHHRQAEGLAVLADGRLAIADEGDGRAATLTVYGPGK